MVTQNLNDLKDQIFEKGELAKRSKANMNKNEAEINNNSVIPMDFIMPSDTIIGGVPGISISHDRKK
jgi:hypothetical protein